MLIEAPCRLGETFTHHRSYSNPKEQYLAGINLQIWHCDIDGVTLMGKAHKMGNGRIWACCPSPSRCRTG